MKPVSLPGKRPNYQKKLAAHFKEIPQMKLRIQATLAKLNEERKANGQPPQILKERWIYEDVETLNLKWVAPHPGHKPSIKYSAIFPVKLLKKVKWD